MMVRGRVMHVEPYQVEEETIPCIQRKPVKASGRIIDYTLSDRNQKDELENQLDKALKLMYKSDLTGVMKIWAYQFVTTQNKLEAHDLRDPHDMGARSIANLENGLELVRR